MRISDWSSDVCSSDLCGNVFAKTFTGLHFRSCSMSSASTAGDSRFDGRYNGSSRPFQPPSACSCCSVALILTLTNSEPKRASSGGVEIRVIFARPRHLPPGPTREDRKSVVKGKSVSVRVDLGGRRILKKKTTKKNIKNKKYK